MTLWAGLIPEPGSDLPRLSPSDINSQRVLPAYPRTTAMELATAPLRRQ